MKCNGTISIIAALDSELAKLLACTEQARTEQLYGLSFTTGTLCGVPVVLSKCGIGKVNAARGTQILIDRFSPAAIINSGIAGGLAPGLSVGDAVVASGLVQHDFDVSVFGHARGYMCTGERDQEPTVYTAEPELAELLTRAAGETLGRQHVHSGLIATGDQFISGAKKKAELYDAFRASAAEMEGGAIAQAAQLSGVPFAVLRTISDLADGTAAESYDTFELHAAQAAAATLMCALTLLAAQTQ